MKVPAVALLLAASHLQEPAPDEPPRGLQLRKESAFDGYTLVAPLRSSETHLIDMDGEVVHTWVSEYTPGNAAFVLDDGHLLRCGRVTNEVFGGGGQGGRIQEMDWDGELLWDFSCSDHERMQHHDIRPLPNGNVLLIAWEMRSRDEAIVAGRDPAEVEQEGLWPDVVVEIEPVAPDGGEVVWEWRVWDHLIQDFDPEGENYGDVTAHPELVDLNADHRSRPPLSEEERRKLAELEDEMRALGYVGGDEEKAADDGADRSDRRRRRGDWLHTNAIDYHPELDLVLLSVPVLGEIWVIDHSTTTAEAAGHEGGRWGRGGDLLYRWGNPKNYGAGRPTDRRLFFQHDARWLGGPDDLRVTVFNNGRGRPSGSYSSVDELRVPFDPERGFTRAPGEPFGPEELAWTYAAPEPETFYSSFISGAHRVPNGNTVVCSGAQGRVFEVTPSGEIVWEFLSPFGADPRLEEDAPPSPPDRDPTRGPGGRGGPGGGPGASPMGLFRVTRMAADHPGLARLGR